MERYTLNPFDFRTLRYAGQTEVNQRAPITNSSQVQIYLAGSLIPQNHSVYGYTILADPDRIQEGYTFQKIVFNQPVRLISPLIEINYITRQGFCLQCSGNGKTTDWVVTQDGGLKRTRNVEKLAQQCLKYILASKNPFTPSLVCHVKDYVGQKFGYSVTTADVASTVQTILQAYQNIQSAQKTVQTLTPEETLQDLTSVVATEDPENPLVVFLSVVVAAYGNTRPIPLNIALQAQN